MIYISAGLYAEGPTDYQFLLPLIDRLLGELAAKLFPAACDLANTLAIDASKPPRRRAERVRLAAVEHKDYCDFFILHADGAGNVAEARRTQIDPGADLIRAAFPRLSIPIVACVPIREIEAWMLVDIEPFNLVLGKTISLELPKQPEAELDPKEILRSIFRHGDALITLTDAYPIFGNNVRFDQLRTLSAFRAFEQELRDALSVLGTAQGLRPET